MAKERMICPFSNRICEECPLYRGRHYYLCFYKKYRGYLGKPEETDKGNSPLVSEARSNKKFEIPSLFPANAIDPFAIDREIHQKKEG